MQSLKHIFATMESSELHLTPRPSLQLYPLWWRYHTPQEIMILLWFGWTSILTVVLYAIKGTAANLVVPVIVRVIGVPVVIFFRPLWTRWQRPDPTLDRAWYCAWWVTTFVVMALPLLMYPLGYMETGMFIEAIHDLTAANECDNDVDVKHVEQAWFGGQPARDWRGTDTSTGMLVLAEALQIAYFGLFPLMTLVPLAIYVVHSNKETKRASEERQSLLGNQDSVYGAIDGIDAVERVERIDRGSGNSSDVMVGRESCMDEYDIVDLESNTVRRWCGSYDPEYDVSVSCILVTSFWCWIIYLVYPVAGPLWCLPPQPEAGDVGYLFSYIMLWMQGQGASHGTALPSSHCCGALSLWIITMRWGTTPMAVGLTLLVPPLIFSTIYLHYHYAIDSVIGCLMGLFVPIITFRCINFIRKAFRLRSFLAVVEPAGPPHSR